MIKIARPAALGVLAQASAVGLLVISGWLLSRAAEHPPVLYLMTTIVAVRALGIGRGVLRYRERLAGHDVALGIQTKLRVRAFDRLASAPPMRRDSDLLSRLINDIDAIQDLVVRVIVPAVSAGLLIIAAGAVISSLSWPAGLTLFAGSVVAGVLVPLITARLSLAAARTRAPEQAALAQEIGLIAHGRLDLSAYGADKDAVERLVRTDARLAAAERRSAYVSGLAGGVQWVVTGAVIVGSLLIGGRAVATADLDPVLLAVLVLTPLAMHEVVAVLPAAAQNWLQCRSALRRVRELIMPRLADSRPVEQVPGDPTAEPRILAEELAIGWPSGDTLAAGLNFAVGPGQRVAVTGPSGVGKSTIAATLMGFVAPHSGHLRIDGRVGYLAQDAHVFDTSVVENVRIGRRDAPDEAVRGALDAVGLDDLALDRMVGEFGGRLSGGEARRLALSRLVVADSNVLILDEPTEHLDAVTADGIIELIFRLRPDAALLVITHDRALIARCDRTVEIAGAIPAMGLPTRERPDRRRIGSRAAA
jgi:thiol reductant ABC exporter CydC subunit